MTSIIAGIWSIMRFYGRNIVRNTAQNLIPTGFAQGCVTLKFNTVFIYKMTSPYATECDCCQTWSNPVLAIDCPVDKGEVVLSARGRAWLWLADMGNPFQLIASRYRSDRSA